VSTSDFIKKYKVAKIYAYEQHQADKDTVMFGWSLTETIDLEEPIVLSSSSKSKKVSDRDREWAVSEGNTAASLKDYKLYFNSLTGLTPSEFLDKWSKDMGALELYRKDNSPSYREGEGAFLIDLAFLIKDERKFVRFGRIYKVIDMKT
jgi:hypothetical protein